MTYTDPRATLKTVKRTSHRVGHINSLMFRTGAVDAVSCLWHCCFRKWRL